MTELPPAEVQRRWQHQIVANHRLAAENANLAMMLRRMIWMARKEPGDTSMKVLAGNAEQLLRSYNLEGSPLRDDTKGGAG